MAETITVTVPELPLVSAPNGDELIAVWDQGRLSRIPQGALRGTRTYSGFSAPPATPSEIMALSPVPVLDDRWRNPETGDEWKVTSLDPFVWTPDGNVKGADGASTVPGPSGAPGERGAPGPSGRTLTKTAGETIPDWRAVILDTNGQFRLADPSNPTHRQRVVGIVPYGGSGLAALIAQTAGDVAGPASNFDPAAPLFVGAGGALTPNPPTSGWRQIVATAVSSSRIVVALGEARVVAEEGTALVVPGGFASPASASDVSAGAATDKFVTPAALDPALSGKLGLAAFLQAAANFNQPASNKTILDWLADLMIEGSDLRSLGFIGDGNSHPLSQRFGTGSAGLAAAKAVFPRAVSLTEEIDGHAIQRRIDLAASGGVASCTVLPRGTKALTSFPINSTAVSACHVSSPGPASIRCVGAAPGCWVHGTEAAPANGAFTWRGVDLEVDPATSTVSTTLLTTFFGTAGIGRGQCLTLQKARFNRGNRGWLIGNMPRGLTVDDLQVFGPDFAMQAGAGIEVKVTDAGNYGSFSYSWKDVIVANYTWGWDHTCTQALEGVLFQGCHAYNGWGFCRVRNNRAGYYYSLLWEFSGCDWEGLGFALDMYRVRGVRVRGGFWIATANNDSRPLPSGVVTDSGEPRHVNFRDVSDFNLDGMMFAAGGLSNGGTKTNYALVHTDAACNFGIIQNSSIFTDHATATCAFRLSGDRAGTIIERGTKLLNWWGAPPVVLYAGTGDQPYQISGADAAANGGMASDEGRYTFSGRTGTRTTDSQGRVSVNLPLRAGGAIPFFRFPPVVSPTASNSNGSVPSLTIIGASSTSFTVEAMGGASAAGIQMDIHWSAEGF
ncbi:hypothetical protein [Methylorubrum extorquens]|uniref:Uncharacterized protein n=1 Tax=Methylorubrum extorquens DSM 13060 TaxID=882800 RepID=H1KC48_METEX|nr:hypothetical protein [Methylorubrum extorquens]EHP94865.1 hypothetical protein MetexDRAFT_0210 [Methylorubrum extorquens DSM 13060]